MRIRATEQQVKQMFANAFHAVSGSTIDPDEFNFAKAFDGKRRLNVSSWTGVVLCLNATALGEEGLYNLTPDEPREDDHPWAKTYPTLSDLVLSAGGQVLQ